MRRNALAATLALTLPAPALAETMPLIAESCASCHGQEGAGQGAILPIAGYDREQFVKVWEAFRNDERPATIMNRIAPGFTDDEVQTLADYFASLD